METGSFSTNWERTSIHWSFGEFSFLHLHKRSTCTALCWKREQRVKHRKNCEFCPLSLCDRRSFYQCHKKNLCQGNSWRSCTRSGRPRGKATAPISWSTSTDLSTSSHLIWSTSSDQSWSTSTDWSTNSDWSRSTDSSTRYKRNSNNQHMIQARALWLNALHLLLSKICIFHTQYLEYTN